MSESIQINSICLGFQNRETAKLFYVAWSIASCSDSHDLDTAEDGSTTVTLHDASARTLDTLNTLVTFVESPSAEAWRLVYRR